MAINKLSINQVGVHQGLAQIKTGEFFIVTALDLDAKKATLKSVAGEEKVVSKATLERWYRTLEPEEAIKLGKMLRENSNGGSDDEVHEQNEPAQAEEPGNGEDADVGEAVTEGNADADAAEEEGVPAGAEAEGTGEGDGVGTADGAGETADDVAGGADNGDAESGICNGEVGGQSAEGTEDSDEVKSPVTPSNAGKDKDKAKTPKKQEPKNAALMKVRQTIIDTVLADSPSIQLKKTTSYDVLKEKHNFAEITHGSNRFNVSVMSKCLTPDQLTKVKVNPASFGWSIDADFTVFDESDIEMAVQLIRQSREYRLANPVTRKKKDSAAGAKK